jgi:hypothetical protein
VLDLKASGARICVILAHGAQNFEGLLATANR